MCACAMPTQLTHSLSRSLSINRRFDRMPPIWSESPSSSRHSRRPSTFATILKTIARPRVTMWRKCAYRVRRLFTQHTSIQFPVRGTSKKKKSMPRIVSNVLASPSTNRCAIFFFHTQRSFVHNSSAEQPCLRRLVCQRDLCWMHRSASNLIECEWFGTITTPRVSVRWAWWNRYSQLADIIHLCNWFD